MTLRIAFMGTSDFAVPALQALSDAGHDIAAVYTQPPRPAGRGMAERKSAVHRAANDLGLPVRTPKSLKSEEELATWDKLNLDLGVVAAYGLILPNAILDAPRFGCINIHASLLPRWRGAAPIQRAIMAGDAKSGICIMQMGEGLDTGPVLLKEATSIAPDETAKSLHDRLAGIGAGLIIDAARGIENETLSATPQPEEGITYAQKIEKAEARIDWQQTAAEIDRKVRGLSPFPGAWFSYKGKRIKCLSGTPEDGKSTPGKLIDDQIGITCGEGIYRVSRLQREGKGPMKAGEFLRGFPMPAGDRVE